MNLSGWAEAIGIVALVVSLVFVGIEIRHNTAATSAQAQLDLNDSMNEIMMTQAENEDLAEIVRVGQLNPKALSESDHHRFFLHAFAVLNHNENAFMFFKNGLIDPEAYTAYANASCNHLSMPGIHSIWRSNESSFQSEFNEYMKEHCPGL
jgi:hypothetical protein